jgi:nucleoside 2-deoxyribosyltransferase
MSCPICNNVSARTRDMNFDDLQVNCNECGVFLITLSVHEDLSKQNRIKIAKLLRERNIKGLGPIAIFRDMPEQPFKNPNFSVVTFSELISTFPMNISERIDRTLVNLTRISEHPGAYVEINQNDKNVFFTQSENSTEVFFLIQQLVDDGYIQGHAGYPTKLLVTAKGWNRVSELEKNMKRDSHQAFVAMWFSQEMEEPYEHAIYKAVEDTGYKAIRIDKKEHNNKIDDEIIAEIQKSKFLIADFTGNRGGVYFEAGYAMGLGKPVIWMVREDHLSSVHFDTRQYSHIVWKDEDDLYSKLFNRIRATIN